MNGHDLEERLHSYYASLAPRDSSRLVRTSRATLDEARLPYYRLAPRRAIWGGLKVAATVVLAMVLLAVLVRPRVGPDTGPVAGPTYDPGAAEHATGGAAGLMRNGGVWVSAGPYLLTSTDNGSSWRAMARPIQDVYALWSPFVLDPDHAWIAGLGSFDAVNPPTWRMPMARTSDGGRTWLYSVISIPQGCTPPSLSFADASHGFMVCFEGVDRTVLRTVDGGANWEVVSQPYRLGAAFTASDAVTLWSARDPSDQGGSEAPFTSLELQVSRDAGATWSTVDLPGLASLASKQGAYDPEPRIAGGPTFVDADHGALAIKDLRNPTAVVIYATADAGRTWAPVVEHLKGADPNLLTGLGRVWVLAPGSTASGLTSSLDSGATWTEVPGIGLPDGHFSWIGFTDRDHAAALVAYNPDGGSTTVGPLMLSSDGGRSWHPADYGNSRAAVPADAVLDPDAAESIASTFEEMDRRSWSAYNQNPLLKEGAWKLLSPYSQQAFGSYANFVLAEPSAAHSWSVGHAQRSPAALSETNLGAGLWQDLAVHADMARAYVVEVTFYDTSAAPDRLVVAPLSSTGEWRIWVATPGA